MKAIQETGKTACPEGCCRIVVDPTIRHTPGPGVLRPMFQVLDDKADDPGEDEAAWPHPHLMDTL